MLRSYAYITSGRVGSKLKSVNAEQERYMGAHARHLAIAIIIALILIAIGTVAARMLR